MYGKQMKLQKILCFLALVSSAVIFLYALGLMTDLYDALYSTMRDPADLTRTDVPGSIIYYDMQPFNTRFLRCAVLLILLACLLFITNTHVRRRYYISNFLTVAAFAAANLSVALYADREIEIYRERFLRLDFDALKAHAALWKTAYTESTIWFDIHYAVFALSMLTSLGLVACTVWKAWLMKEERRLIAQGKEAGG